MATFGLAALAVWSGPGLAVAFQVDSACQEAAVAQSNQSFRAVMGFGGEIQPMYEFAPPDRMRIEGQFIVIGRTMYSPMEGGWLAIEGGSGVAAPFAPGTNFVRCSFVGPALLDSAPATAYDFSAVSPPVTGAVQIPEVTTIGRLWVGVADRLPRKIEVVFSGTGAPPEVEYREGGMAVLYEYDPTISIEVPSPVVLSP